MLSSRQALAIGTLSLVAVSTLSTAVLVTGGTQRLTDPAVVSPPLVVPGYRAPRVVVPSAPGHTAPGTPVRRLGPGSGPEVVLPDGSAGRAPDGGTGAGAAPTGPSEPEVDDPPVVLRPTVERPERPGRGKHLGNAKQRDHERGRHDHDKSARPERVKGPKGGKAEKAEKTER